MKKLCCIIALFGIGVAANAQSKPAWVDNPSVAYPERLYVSAVGEGCVEVRKGFSNCLRPLL
jgi:hypothetical protein